MNISIYYFSGTHWDREWYQPFQGFRYRLVKFFDNLITTLEENPIIETFHLDGQTIVLEDYLDIDSSKKERLQNLISEGRIKIGPWYVMPDEYLVSGESLIKNLQIGHKICSDWGVNPLKFGYICDIFGHTPQLPQILSSCGINGALIARGVNQDTYGAYFKWESPDGSFVTTHKTNDRGGYGGFYWEVMYLYYEGGKKIEDLERLIKNYIDAQISRSEIPVVVVMDAQDHKFIHNEFNLIINTIKKLYPDDCVKIEPITNMTEEVKKYPMQTAYGELHIPGKVNHGNIDFNYVITNTLSSRYDLKLRNDMCQILLEKWVQPLMAMSKCLINENFLNVAYKYLIKNHPHDSICGCGIDQIHRDMHYRFDQCEIISKNIISDIFAYDNVDSGNEYGIRIYNPLPYRRREVCSVDIEFRSDFSAKFLEPIGGEKRNSFNIYDADGKKIEYALTKVKTDVTKLLHPSNGNENCVTNIVDVYTITMKVELPAFGYSEYKITPNAEPTRNLRSLCSEKLICENKFISLSIGNGGEIDVYNKETGQLFANVISYKCDGEVGDGWWHISPISNECSYSIVKHIRKIEDNSLRCSFCISCEIAEGLNIDTTVTLDQDCKYVKVKSVVKNSLNNHRLKLSVNTNCCEKKYYANEMFTFVERDTGVDYSTSSWKECDVCEKPFNGIAFKRNIYGNGLAVVCNAGLHEVAGLDDANGSIDITMLRCFSKTVGTDGEFDGQMHGVWEFEYCIMPMTNDVNYCDLQKLQDVLQTGIMTVNKFLDVPQKNEMLRFNNRNIYVSLIKKSKGHIIIRLCNLSDEDVLVEDFEVVGKLNLLEEKIKFDKKITLRKWEIATYIV